MKVKAKAELMHGGTVHHAGDEFEIAECDADAMIAAGFIEPPATKKKTRKNKKTESEG